MKPFTTIGAAIFAVISVAHLLRLFFGWEVIINRTTIPLWVSIPGCLVPGVLAVMIWRERRK